MGRGIGPYCSLPGIGPPKIKSSLRPLFRYSVLVSLRLIGSSPSYSSLRVRRKNECCLMRNRLAIERRFTSDRRLARHYSHAVALVNQLLHRNAFEADVVLSNEGQHFAHGLALRAVRGVPR